MDIFKSWSPLRLISEWRRQNYHNLTCLGQWDSIDLMMRSELSKHRPECNEVENGN